MANVSLSDRFDVGVVGLDPCGRKLARTMAGHRMSVLAFDPNPQNLSALLNEAPGSAIQIASSVAQLTLLLCQFRTVVISGSDASHHSFNELLEHIEGGDLIIDAGHCHFKTCSRRSLWLDERNIRHLDVGIIGGGEDGRCGPVFMIGGRPETYKSVLPLIQRMANGATGECCLSHLGPAAAGHFVKMIHDAIEYSLAQLLAETSNLLKRALDRDENEAASDIPSGQAGMSKNRSHADSARWTSETAYELEGYSPTIAASVGMRIISDLERKNDIATTLFRQPLGELRADTQGILDELQCALRAAVLITHAQGLAVLQAGSERYEFHIDITEVIRLWKKCDAIHGALLDEIASAIQAAPNLPNILYDDDLSEQVMERQECLRHAVWRAGQLRVSVPALKASLDYLDSYRGAWLPGNLIQARPQPAVTRHSAPSFGRA